MTCCSPRLLDFRQEAEAEEKACSRDVTKIQARISFDFFLASVGRGILSVPALIRLFNQGIGTSQNALAGAVAAHVALMA